MKYSINTNLEELHDDNVTISALTVTLNLTVKRFELEAGRAFYYAEHVHKILFLARPSSPIARLVT